MCAGIDVRHDTTIASRDGGPKTRVNTMRTISGGTYSAASSSIRSYSFSAPERSLISFENCCSIRWSAHCAQSVPFQSTNTYTSRLRVQYCLSECHWFGTKRWQLERQGSETSPPVSPPTCSIRRNIRLTILKITSVTAWETGIVTIRETVLSGGWKLSEQQLKIQKSAKLASKSFWGYLRYSKRCKHSFLRIDKTWRLLGKFFTLSKTIFEGICIRALKLHVFVS